MKWRPDEYLEKIYTSNSPKYSFNAATKKEWLEWRSGLKDVFIRDLGGFPTTGSGLCEKVLEEVELDDYIRQRIEIKTDENLYMPVYILVPKNRTGKLPAVIACPGHGRGSRDIVRIPVEGAEKKPDPVKDTFGVALVKRGFLVAVPDLLGFGDRMLAEDSPKLPQGGNSCHRISTFLLMMGKTTAGARVYDVMRLIDYLSERKDVDSCRIGCMGHSGGGTICAFASAVDERIKTVVIGGYTNTFRKSIMAMSHCICNFVPGLVEHAEMPDIIGMIAPRPLLVESGINDRIFPVAGALEAFSKLERIYDLLGERDKLEKDIFEGGHEVSGRLAYDWFEKWL